VITGTAEAGSTVTVNGVTATVRGQRHLHGHDPGSGDDGPLVVNVATTDAAGNTATATQTLTVDRGTTVAITASRWRQHDQRCRGGSWHRDHGPG
jgi:hypothetical protein